MSDTTPQMDISMCPVHQKKAPEPIPSQVPPNMDISMCPVVHHNPSPSQLPPPQSIQLINPHDPSSLIGKDISMCPVHNGTNASAEALTQLAQYQRKQEKELAYKHVSSSKFLEGAPRFPEARMPVETQDESVVGDVFPDSKPIYGQRFALSTSPSQSNIPKSQRSKALPQFQLPPQVPQVPNDLKQIAEQVQQLQCTSDDAENVAIIDGKPVIVPGKDYKDETWTFPSHQRFYNAMKKKGWNAAEIDIPYIVSIHNTINQQAWSKIMQYERFHNHNCPTPSLLKFQGRPQDLSPKARFLSTIGYNAPYDRHDWTIDRCGTDVRYIIDFYDGPSPSPDVPVSTHLDVRPALDSPWALLDRARAGFEGLFAMRQIPSGQLKQQQQQQPQQSSPQSSSSNNSQL